MSAVALVSRRRWRAACQGQLPRPARGRLGRQLAARGPAGPIRASTTRASRGRERRSRRRCPRRRRLAVAAAEGRAAARARVQARGDPGRRILREGDRGPARRSPRPHLALAELLAPHAVHRHEAEEQATLEEAARQRKPPPPPPARSGGVDISVDRVIARLPRPPIEADPAARAARRGPDRLRDRVGRLDAAEAAFQELIRREKEKPGAARCATATSCSTEKKDPAAAIEQYRQALIWTPDDDDHARQDRRHLPRRWAPRHYRQAAVRGRRVALRRRREVRHGPDSPRGSRLKDYRACACASDPALEPADTLSARATPRRSARRTGCGPGRSRRCRRARSRTGARGVERVRSLAADLQPLGGDAAGRAAHAGAGRRRARGGAGTRGGKFTGTLARGAPPDEAARRPGVSRNSCPGCIQLPKKTTGSSQRGDLVHAPVGLQVLDGDRDRPRRVTRPARSSGGLAGGRSSRRSAQPRPASARTVRRLWACGSILPTLRGRMIPCAVSSSRSLPGPDPRHRRRRRRSARPASSCCRRAATRRSRPPPCGEGLRLFAERRPAAVLLDLKLPDGTGIDVLRELQRHAPGTPVVVISGHGSVAEAVEAMKVGATDFIEKPVSGDRLFRGPRPHPAPAACPAARPTSRRSPTASRYGMVGRSEAMRRIYQLVEMAAPHQVPRASSRGRAGRARS